MKLIGSICALATPFGADGALDLEAFGRLIDYQLAGGTHALVVAGSTGEAHCLAPDEYVELLQFAVRHVDGRAPVIAGTGHASTRHTVSQTQLARSLGADAALVVTPYYVRPTQHGLLQHYSSVAESGGLPVLLYNVPSRTACDLLPETVALLAAHPNIVAIKEAVTNAQRMHDLLDLQNDHFDVLSGDDPTFVRAMTAGARGVISVAANVAPRQIRRLVDECVAGRHADAAALNAEMLSLYEVLAAEPNPIPVKWCLGLLEMGTAQVRLPLTTLGAVHHDRAAHAMHTLFSPEIQPRHSSAA